MVYPFRGEMTSIGEEEKRHAFTVKLGMRVSTSGRQSQADCIQNVKVTFFFCLWKRSDRSVQGWGVGGRVGVGENGLKEGEWEVITKFCSHMTVLLEYIRFVPCYAGHSSNTRIVLLRVGSLSVQGGSWTRQIRTWERYEQDTVCAGECKVYGAKGM